MLGATIQGAAVSSTPRELSDARVAPNKIGAKLSKNSSSRCILVRGRNFTPDELELAQDFIAEASKLDGASGQPYFKDLVQSLPRWVISSHINPDGQLADVLERLEKWTSETYEGH